MDDPHEKETPTQEELALRKEFAERARQLRSEAPETAGPFPSAEEMLREDRLR